MHKVSTCIYTKNRAHLLPGAIESVLAQEGIELEILLLDDGSEDETQKVFDLHRDDPRFRFFGKGDPHLFSRATGDFVCSLPDDDRLLGADSLARRANALSVDPSLAFVFSSVKGWNVEDGSDRGLLQMGHISDHDVATNAAPFDKLFLHCFVPWPSGMFRRSMAPDFDGDYPGEGSLSRDWFFWQRLSRIGDSAYLSGPTVSLGHHEGQQSSYEGIAQGGFLKSYLALWRYWIEKGHRLSVADWGHMRNSAEEVVTMQYGKVESDILDVIYRKMDEFKPELTDVSICLSMIAKNDEGSDESHVIVRALESCKGLVNTLALITTSRDTKLGEAQDNAVYWCNTNSVAPRFDALLWVDDFAEARNAALKSAQKTTCDWIMLLDCDEWIEGDPEAIKQILRKATQNAVALPILTCSGHINPRITFIRNIPGWEWKYRLHETLMFNGEIPKVEAPYSTESPLSGPHIRTLQDGARSQDPEKMEKDARILAHAYHETGEVRYLFFLAHTMQAKVSNSKDAPTPEEMQEVVGKWESYINKSEGQQAGLRYKAYLELGRVLRATSDPQRAVANWLMAYNLIPTRVEALGEVASIYLSQRAFAMARVYALATAHAPIPDPATAEFLEMDWGRWKGLLMLIESLANLGQVGVVLQYIELALSRPDLPDEPRANVIKLREEITHV